jgi:hypothetical protein
VGPLGGEPFDSWFDSPSVGLHVAMGNDEMTPVGSTLLLALLVLLAPW